MRGLVAGIVASVAIACGPLASPPAAPPASPQASSSARGDPIATQDPEDEKILSRLRSGTPIYKVTYDLVVTTKDEQVLGSLVIAQRPPSFKLAQTLAIAGERTTIITIANVDATYVCLNVLASTEALSKVCLQGASPQELASLQPPRPPVPQDLSDTDIGPIPGREILGVKARCFLFTPKRHSDPLGIVEATACYTSEAVPLVIETKYDDFQAKLTGAAWTTSVGPDDFALPYPARKMPSNAPPLFRTPPPSPTQKA